MAVPARIFSDVIPRVLSVAVRESAVNYDTNLRGHANIVFALLAATSLAGHATFAFAAAGNMHVLVGAATLSFTPRAGLSRGARATLTFTPAGALDAPGGGDSETVTFYADDSISDSISASHAVAATVLAAMVADSVDGYGQAWWANNTGQSKYYSGMTFLGFDTSSIPDGATIVSAVLTLWGGAGGSPTDINVQVRAATPSDPIAVGDWLTPAAFAALPLAASVTATHGADDARLTFTSEAGMVGAISDTGVTWFVVSTDEWATAVATPGDDTGFFFQYTSSPPDEFRPYLVIGYTDGGTPAEITVRSDGTYDGGVEVGDVDDAVVLAATEPASTYGSYQGYVGTAFDGEQYYCEQVGLAFDTSAIPDSATIDSVELHISLRTFSGTSPSQLEVRSGYDWPGTANDKWRTPAQFAALTKVATFDPVPGDPEGYQQFASLPALLAAINKSGYTQFWLCDDAWAANTVQNPGVFTIISEGLNYTDDQRAKLTVEYMT